jgi:3-isopropylmalate/(R)-2-methylmalate dehydratase large subunit
VKIPTKKELIELQKKYRTDKKIGEVFGVPGRLVAYWRTKKKIGPYNQPKYSREKITELWERFGNDKLGGLELGVSGPGFRQWRIKYGLKQKPIRLKFEQLELSLPDSSRKLKTTRKETFVRKLIAKKAGLKSVEEGQIVEVAPDMTVVGVEAALVLNHFKEMGAARLWDKSKVIVIFDKPISSLQEHNHTSLKAVREFIKKHSIEKFYDIGWGVSHQVIAEEGLVLPNHLVFSSNSHALAYGGIGALSTEVSAIDIASVWASGRTWMKVPQTIRVVVKGLLARGVGAKDIVLKLFHDFGAGGANYRSVEFCGDTISTMSISQRFTMAGLTRDFNAKSVLVPFDGITQKYLKKFTRQKFAPMIADLDARYENELEIDVSYLTPQVATIDHLSHVKPVEEVSGKKLDLIVMGGCSHGTLADLEQAATILKGRRVHRDTRVLVLPGSRNAYLDAIEKGFIKMFVESGCVVASPGFDIRQWSFGDTERTLATCNCSHLHGKEIYLGSPATAAASALEGAITDPRKYL